MGAASVGYYATTETPLPPHYRYGIASCEEATPPVSAPSSDSAVDQEADDPYENLPEDDDETDCTMCKTFRQGPCRPFWRKLERCFKDHESEENGSVKCMRYFSAHQTCLMDYTNLYQLISLDLKQELVSEVEQAVTKAERRTLDPAAFSIDWKLWREFYDEMGPSFRQTVPHHRRTEPSSEPLWRRLPPTREGTHLEPVLLQTKVTLSMTPPPTLNGGEDSSSSSSSSSNSSSVGDNMLLKIAYAVDQDGFVIGLSYNSRYGDLVDQAKKSSTAMDDAKDGKDKPTNAREEGEPTEVNDDPLAQTYDFDFYILPGECQSVRICAMYAENPIVADPGKQILDVFLYKSKSINLHHVATSPAETVLGLTKKASKASNIPRPEKDQVFENK
jgi:hypothetical protein